VAATTRGRRGWPRVNDNDRSIVGFVMLAHAVVHTYELSIPILLVIWLQEFPVGTGLLGTVVAVGYALFGIGALPAGVLADRFGSHRLVIACLVGMGASFLLLGLAPGVVTITVALALWGLAASVYHPAGLSLISTGVEDRGTGFAYHGVAGNVGIAVGPLVTALLLLVFDWRLVSMLLVVPAVLGAIYAVSVEFDPRAAVDIEEADAATDGGGTADADGTGDGADEAMSFDQFVADSRTLFAGGFAVVFLIVMMNGLFYRGTLTFLPGLLGDFLPDVASRLQLFAPDSPMAEEFDASSYLYSGLLMVGIAGQYVGGKLTDRVRVETGLIGVFLGLAAVAAVFVPAAEAGLGPLVIVSSLLGFLLFALQPFYQATVAEYSPPDDRGLSYGYTYLGSFGVGAAGAALVGSLLSVTTVGWTFRVLGAFPVVGAVLAGALLRSARFR